MFLAQTVNPLALVAMLKPLGAGRLTKADNNEVRKRCRHCGWVNVFHPERVNDRVIAFKNYVAVGGTSATAERPSPGHLTAASLSPETDHVRRSSIKRSR
jgi:hypothetical protein